MTPIALAFVALALFISGLLTGRYLIPVEPQAEIEGPVCGCGHSLAVHDPKTNRCHAETKRKHFDRWGDRAGWHWAQCKCLRYVGPEPISSIWLPPPITGSNYDGQ